MAKKQAQRNNPDAQFRFSLSEDGMKLGVSRYFPPNGGEGPSVDLLKRQIAAAGVQLPVDTAAAMQVIDALQKTGEVKRIPLVHGKPAQEPQNATLSALGDLNYPVFPGDRFARKRPALSAEMGMTIDGRSLSPTQDFDPEDIEIGLGENVNLDPISGCYVSQVWGMAQYKDGVISVNQLWHITEDAVFIRGTVHAKDFSGRDITAERIEKEMQDIGVTIDVDLDNLKSLLRRAKVSGAPMFDQVIVAGRHPVPGRDGWFEYLVANREETGIEDESGRLDFRDKGSYPLVEPGEIIGRLHEPTSGEGGIDIYGKTIPAHGGKPFFVHLGENVLVHDDKTTFEAKAKGVVSMERGVLSVTDCLIIKGNVDLASGNVKVEHGSVKILGSIQAGFIVTAPKHVIVHGSVESANVIAGGDVKVHGGILMPEGGLIKAEGTVSANYATNASIAAGGSVYIANDVTNSTIETEGRFVAVKGKGHIQGGMIAAAKGIEAKRIGSELGVATTVEVRIPHADDSELREERRKVKKAILKIDDALGVEHPEVILTRTPPEKRKAVSEVLKHRITLVKRRKAISEQLTQLALKRQEELAGIKIKVHHCIYPGSTIRFGAKGVKVSQYTEAKTLYWSERNREIVSE